MTYKVQCPLSLSCSHAHLCTHARTRTRARARTHTHTHTHKCDMSCCIHNNWMMWSITTLISGQSNTTTKFFQWCVSWFHHLNTENNVAFIAEIPQYFQETFHRVKRITIFPNLMTQLRRHFLDSCVYEKMWRSIRELYVKTYDFIYCFAAGLNSNFWKQFK